MQEADEEAAPVRPSFVRRLIAFLVDGVALMALGLILLAMTTAVLGPTVVLRLETPASPVEEVRLWRVILNAGLLVAMSAAYFVLTWARQGSTPGQRLLRLEVATTAPPGGRPPAARAALRWALLGGPLGLVSAAAVDLPLLFLAVAVVSFFWLGAVVLTTLFSRTGRGLHDRLSGTVVVRRA